MKKDQALAPSTCSNGFRPCIGKVRLPATEKRVLFLTTPVRTDIDAQAAIGPGGELAHDISMAILVIIGAYMCIEPFFPRFEGIEIHAGEGRDGAYFNALSAITTSPFHRFARLERGIGQHRSPSCAGAGLRGYQKNALAYPSPPR